MLDDAELNCGQRYLVRSILEDLEAFIGIRHGCNSLSLGFAELLEAILPMTLAVGC